MRMHLRTYDIPRRRRSRSVAWRSKSPLVVIAIIICAIYLIAWSVFTRSTAPEVTGAVHGLQEAVEDYQPNQQPILDASIFADSDLHEMLETYGFNKKIAISIVDKKYVDFALNFYKTSVDKIKASCKHVMICLDEESFVYLKQNGIYCLKYDTKPLYDQFKQFIVPENGTNNGDFGTPEYYLKTNMKTYIMLGILKQGYSVLLMDVDIVLFDDPFPYFTCKICDIHAAKDRQQINTGFIYVHPTQNSINLYKTVWNLYVGGHRTHDQSYFNIALQTITIKNNGNFSKLVIHYLPPKLFVCGVYYFENGNHVYGDQDCPNCVMVHNNYIGSIAAKRYRFKENHMWWLDADQYYTSKVTRYLTYDNPYYFDNETWKKETEALLNALIIASKADRVLILPMFHCCNCESGTCSGAIFYRCPLLNMLRITDFDAAFQNEYREHSFLKHPLVPDEVKSATPRKLLISSDTVKHVMGEDTSDYEKFLYNSNGGSWTDAIELWLDKYKDERILHFHSMYDTVPSHMEIFRAPLRTQGMVCKTYQQWDVDGPFRKKKKILPT